LLYLPWCPHQASVWYQGQKKEKIKEGGRKGGKKKGREGEEKNE
jgi:hypothetical protein